MSRKVVIPFSDSPTDDRFYLANFSDADYEKYLSMTEEQKKKVIKKVNMLYSTQDIYETETIQ